MLSRSLAFRAKNETGVSFLNLDCRLTPRLLFQNELLDDELAEASALVVGVRELPFLDGRSDPHRYHPPIQASSITLRSAAAASRR